MLRSRLQEHFNRVVRENLLTLFGCTATLSSLECSIILQGAAQMSDEAKYRAACILEILTGQRVTLAMCRVEEEDPQFTQKSGEEQRAMERLKSAIMHRSNSNATAADFRALGNGTILKTTLRRAAMYDFLEKTREFYLPDVLLAKSAEYPSLSTSMNHRLDKSSSTATTAAAAYFASWNRSKLPQYSRYIAPNSTDPSLTTAFILRSSDLLKFPDVEAHFEALGSAVFSETGNNSENGLKLIIRPTLKINYPLGKKLQTSSVLPKVNHYGVFNYLLSKFFNPYMTRPKLSIKK